MLTMSRLTPPLSFGASLLAILFLIAGCVGTGASVSPGQLGARYLPPVRELPHHPDSLVHLSIEEKDNRLEFKFERPYGEMLRTWSASWQGVGSGAREVPGSLFRSYATFWSREMSLAALIPGRGIEGLSEDLARQILSDRQQEYEDVVQIDVYRFATSPYTPNAFSGVQLEGPGARITLRDAAGHEYRPIRVESQVPVEAFQATRRVLYARNLIYFDRVVEGRDILEDVERLELVIEEIPGNTSYAFTWTLPGSDASDH